MEIKKNDWKVWLILSTFAIEFRELGYPKEQEEEYDRNYRKGKKWWQVTPQDICTFRKMFIISLFMFPVSYFGHLFNWISKSKDASAGRAFLFFIVFYLISAMLCLPGTDGKPNTFILSSYHQAHCLTLSSKLLFYYALTPALVLAVLAFFLCLGLIIAGVVYPFMWLYENYKNRQYLKNSMKKHELEFQEKETNFIYAMYKSLKDKYCTKITYIE